MAEGMKHEMIHLTENRSGHYPSAVGALSTTRPESELAMGTRCSPRCDREWAGDPCPS